MTAETGTIRRLHRLLTEKQLSCTELTNAYLEAIEEENKTLNAYVRVTPETALAAAGAVDKKIAAGEEIAPLEGIPMTLKDNISTDGIETTCCSKILKGYVPIYDATVWKTLKGQNAVLLGKTNMDEFAMGSRCETSCFGGAKNPHNRNHVAGGSSGGGASAVGANLAAYALGSDTGGSIRQPAGFCGVVGLKPTYGAVSRFGLIAYASSLDQIGPIASSVEDTAAVFDAISQQDPMDSTSRGAQNGPTLEVLGKSIRGLRIGVVEEFFDGLRPDVQKAVEEAIQVYRSLGAEVVRVHLSTLKVSLPVYYILACAEATSNLGRYDGIRYGHRAESYTGVNDMICKTRSEGFGKEVKRRILLGNYVLSSGYYDAYYKKAQKLRGTIIRSFEEAFGACDVILTPTAPQTAFAAGQPPADPVEEYLSDICTVPVNIAGLPALSVPCGFGDAGLPVGMQLIGKRFDEAAILNAAWHYERETREKTFRAAETGVRL